MMTSFKEIYTKFRSQLRESWLTNEVTAHFGPTATLESMFQYLWSRSEVQQVLLPPSGDSRISRKGVIEAEKFRTEGNRLYKERKLEAALLAYNYSIIASPHPGLDETPSQAHQGLSLAFANRSAVLYETGQFTASLADADRALTFGYPLSKQHRLQERRAKCLKALGKSQEAKTILDETIKSLSTLSLTEKEETSIRKSLTKLQGKCEGVNNAGATAQLYERVFYTGPHLPPPLPSPHRELTCLSNALSIHYTPIRGRHLIADRDIQPGEVLAVEEALEAVVRLDATLRTHCSHCLKRCPVPLPCPSCSLVVFCSEACQRRGVSGGHGAECQVLPAMVALQLDPAPALALRVLSATTLDKLRITVAELQQEGGGVRTVPQVGKEYHTLYHLQGHVTARTEIQLQETAAIACILTHVLFDECPTFLKNESGLIMKTTEEDLVLVGGQLMRLILLLECNIHVTKEAEAGAWGRETEASKRQGSRGRDVGWSVYSVLSMINHSCVPNALSTSHGSTKFLYSVSFIPRGAEVTDSYGERYVSHDRETRRASLQQHYFFCCDCVACQADWPLFKNLSGKTQLRCPSCCQALIGFKCHLCDLACTSPTTTKTGVRLYDASSVHVQLNKSWAVYSKAALEISTGKVTPQLMVTVIEVLLLLDKYALHPNQAYITAQETLMTCFDLLGSVCLLVPS